MYTIVKQEAAKKAGPVIRCANCCVKVKAVLYGCS